MSNFFPCGTVGYRKLFLAIGSCFFLAACLIVPYPTLQERLDEKDVLQIKPGETTRMDIVEIFGEPDVFDSSRYAVYDKYTTNVGLVGGFFGVPSGVQGKIKYTAFRALFQFDANAVVERIVYSQIDYGIFSESGKRWLNGVVDNAGKRSFETNANGLDKPFSKSCAWYCGRPLVLSSNGDIAMSSESEVHVFDSKSMKRLQRYRVKRPISFLAFLANPDYLVARTGAGLSIFRLDRAKPVDTLSVPNNINIMSSDIASTGQLVALGSYGGRLMLWNHETDDLRQVLSIERGSVISVAFSPDGELLAANMGGEIIVLDVATLKTLSLTARSENVATSSSGVRFSPDGRYLTSNSCIHVALWETKAIKQAFSNGGTKQVIGPKTVLLNPYVAAVDSRRCTAAALSFSTNDRIVAVMSSDGSVSFLDVEKTEFVSAFGYDDDKKQISDMAFNPVNNDLVVLTGSAIELWRAKPDSNLAVALKAP